MRGRKEIPAADTGAVRPHSEALPGMLDDLAGLVSYALTSGLVLCIVVTAVLSAFLKWSLSASLRWGLAAGLVPLGLLGIVCLRLLVALANAALEHALGRDLDGSGRVGDTEIRFIPLRGAFGAGKVLEGGVAPEDMVAFVKGLAVRGSGQKAWRNIRLPSGRVCDDAYHQAMVRVLENAGLWRDRGPRCAGRLLGSPEEIISLLGLNY